MAVKNRRGGLINGLAAGIAVISAAFFFAACSNDDKKGEERVDYSSFALTQHTWEVTIASYHEPFTNNFYDLYVTLKFNADGTGVLRSFIDNEANEHPLSPVNFTYRATANMIMWIKGNNASQNLPFDRYNKSYSVVQGDPTVLNIDGDWLLEETGVKIPQLWAKR